MNRKVILANEDFSDLPVGPFPSDYFATGEYHYLPPPGTRGRWYQPTAHHTWRPNVAWVVFEDGGRHRMLQTLLPDKKVPRMLVTGDVDWTDYCLTVALQPLRGDGFVGVLFRFQTSRTTYRAGFDGGNKFLIVRDNHEESATLAEAPFEYSCNRTYTVEIRVEGERIVALVNGQKLLEVSDGTYLHGKVGFTAKTTAVFDSLKVEAAEKVRSAFVQTRDKAQRELDAASERYPKPILARRLDTRGFGAARNLRFGHLRSGKELDIVLAQAVPFLPGDANSWTIRAVTAMDLAGNVLCRFGEPSADPAAGLTTCDLPIQVYDIDGDGRDEVLCMRNFRFYVLDGRDGSVKAEYPLPQDQVEENRFGRLLGDSIIIANFRGLPSPRDIVIKNRYKQFWAYDDRWNLLWSRQSRQTGHFAMPYDFDGAGRDDLFIGYGRIGCDGSLKWDLPWSDHTDEIAIGPFDPGRDGVQIAIVSGEEGFNILSPDGQVLHRDLLGHAQRLSAARFRDDLPGVQFYVTTYWGHLGIISLHDCTGKKLLQFQPTATGNVLSPVNWTGGGTELALLSGSVPHGGMLDGFGRRVVTFPDDGHPQLCAEAVNLLGDERDEILLWDTNSIWIYTQDRPTEAEKIYKPIRYPHYNTSNYRAEISLPPELFVQVKSPCGA